MRVTDFMIDAIAFDHHRLASLDQHHASQPHERSAIFVNGPNINYATRAIGLAIDFATLLQQFQTRCVLTGAHYYTVINDAPERDGLRSFLAFLKRSGWRVMDKPIPEHLDHVTGARARDDIDVDLAVDFVVQARRLDHVVLFSGDGDFVPAVLAAQNAGARVTVVSTTEGGAAGRRVVSADLQDAADAFLDLTAVADSIRRHDNPG